MSEPQRDGVSCETCLYGTSVADDRVVCRCRWGPEDRKLSSADWCAQWQCWYCGYTWGVRQGTVRHIPGITCPHSPQRVDDE